MDEDKQGYNKYELKKDPSFSFFFFCCVVLILISIILPFTQV